MIDYMLIEKEEDNPLALGVIDASIQEIEEYTKHIYIYI